VGLELATPTPITTTLPSAPPVLEYRCCISNNDLENKTAAKLIFSAYFLTAALLAVWLAHSPPTAGNAGSIPALEISPS